MLNILYCGNAKVFDGMIISLLSITKHCQEELHVYIMTMDLRNLSAENDPICEFHAQYLESMIREVNGDSRVILVDITDLFKKDMMASANIKTSYTPYTLTRLYADCVPEIPDQILYLDTDTVANASISPIFDVDLTGYEYAGVIDYLGKWFIDARYINAGVLFLNMKMIRQTGLFERAREMVVTKKMWFPDQTALNKLVQRKLFIPRGYNEQRRFRKDTVIQHFCKSIRLLPFYHTVNIKPWEVEKIRSVYKIHAYDEILDEYLERRKQLEGRGNDDVAV